MKDLAGRNIIAGAPSPTKTAKFSVVSPLTGEEVGEGFYEGTSGDIHTALLAAKAAHTELRWLSRRALCDLMRGLARKLAEQKDEIIALCHQETGLDLTTRLIPEFGRMLEQLNMFGDLAVSGAGVEARIITAQPDRTPKPRPDLRRERIGIGPVVVIEPSNFPLAFGVAGQDTASAWAAGCPVIVKSHPLHAGTSALIGQIVTSFLHETNLPNGMFSLIQGGERQGRTLIKHPLTRGISFTGSRGVGADICKVVGERENPLAELSLELGSVNPVFMLSGALQKNVVARAEQLAGSVLGGAGQFCTKPQLFFVPKGSSGDEFLRVLAKQFSKQAPMTLLSRGIAESYNASIESALEINSIHRLAQGQETDTPTVASVRPTLLEVTFETFLKHPWLAEEIFGPAALAIRVSSERMIEAAEFFKGELTATIHCDEVDFDQASDLSYALELSVGRIIFNGVPTGVEVCEALTHNAPWPSAVGRYSTTGPGSIDRWFRYITYQGAPESLLSEGVASGNPLNIDRWVDGELVKAQ